MASATHRMPAGRRRVGSARQGPHTRARSNTRCSGVTSGKVPTLAWSEAASRRSQAAQRVDGYAAIRTSTSCGKGGHGISCSTLRGPPPDAGRRVFWVACRDVAAPGQPRSRRDTAGRCGPRPRTRCHRMSHSAVVTSLRCTQPVTDRKSGATLGRVRTSSASRAYRCHGHTADMRARFGTR